jgi:hypothetical protein
MAFSDKLMINPAGWLGLILLAVLLILGPALLERKIRHDEHKVLSLSRRSAR